MQKLALSVLASLLLFLAACDSRTTESETREVTYLLDKNKPSPMFWDYAVSTSLLQKELGKLAKEKAGDSLATALADSALLVHTQALQQLRRIAKKHEQVQLPDSLTGADSTTVEEFKLLEGEEFTARYLEYLEQSNRSQLSRYQEALSETEDPALREWLNTMKRHLASQLQAFTAQDTLPE